VQRRAYAAEHDDYYFALHSIESGWRDFFYGVGPELEAMRTRVLPQISRILHACPTSSVWGPMRLAMKGRDVISSPKTSSLVVLQHCSPIRSEVRDACDLVPLPGQPRTGGPHHRATRTSNR
jgi:hypothetical protein